MEVRVEAVDDTIPEGCYIAVRVGDVQKQAQYDASASKCYRFPHAGRFGKVDVFQRVGTCDVSWGADEPESRCCKAIGPAGDTGIRLKIDLSRPSCGQKKELEFVDKQTRKEEKKKDVMSAAKKYMQDKDVEGILTGAMRALLKSTPDDAANFLCDYIRRQYGARDADNKKEASCPAFPQLEMFEAYRRAYIPDTSPAQQVAFAKIYDKFPSHNPKTFSIRSLSNDPRSKVPAISSEELAAGSALAGLTADEKAKVMEALAPATEKQAALDGGSLEELLQQATAAVATAIAAERRLLQQMYNKKLNERCQQKAQGRERAKALKMDVAETMTAAAIDGSLQRCVKDVKSKVPLESLRKWHMKPSVGSWLSLPPPRPASTSKVPAISTEELVQQVLMGAGATAGIQAALRVTSASDLKDALTGLTADEKAQVTAAIGGVLDVDALRLELQGLRLGMLKTRARTEHCDAAAVAAVDDDSDPKAAIIELIINAGSKRADLGQKHCRRT